MTHPRKLHTVAALALLTLAMGGCRTSPHSASLDKPRQPNFVDDTRAAGLTYSGHGKCVSWGDFNNDGLLDLYVGIVGDHSRLYMNQGDGTFTDESATTGLWTPTVPGAGVDGHGAVWADFNNDGILDLFAASSPEAGLNPRQQKNRLYLGNGNVFLVDHAEKAGVEGAFIRRWDDANEEPINRSCGVTVADYDNDGDLDIYVAKGDYRSGIPNSLYRNNGDGTFTDVAKEAGVATTGATREVGGGYACVFADFDNDGHADLVIGNLDVTNNGVGWQLFRNNGDGTFADVSKDSGVAGGGMCSSIFVGDVNNDGKQDIFIGIANAFRGNLLYINKSDRQGMKFEEVGEKAGVADKLNVRGATMADVNHDGWLDIFVVEYERGMLYINNKDGTFTERGQEFGINNPYGHGCAFADVDGDGDLDLYTANWRMMGHPHKGNFQFFRNTLNDKNWLKVRVKGTTSNRSAIGARITVWESVLAGNGLGHKYFRGRLVGYRQIIAGTGAYSTPPLEQHFGLDHRYTYEVVAEFPMTQRRVVLTGVRTGQTLDVIEPAEPAESDKPSPSGPATSVPTPPAAAAPR